MNRKLGWDLPPGVTQADIDRQFGEADTDAEKAIQQDLEDANALAETLLAEVTDKKRAISDRVRRIVRDRVESALESEEIEDDLRADESGEPPRIYPALTGSPRPKHNDAGLSPEESAALRLCEDTARALESINAAIGATTEEPEDTDADYAALEEMQQYGGSYVKALASAFIAADAENRALLRPAFVRYRDKYLEQRSLRTGGDTADDSDPMDELCAHCGCTLGSHHGGTGAWPRNYCPGHEGRMDWEDGPGTVFAPTGSYRKETRNNG